MRKHSFLRGLTRVYACRSFSLLFRRGAAAERFGRIHHGLKNLSLPNSKSKRKKNNKRLEELRDDVSQKRAYRDELQGKIDIIQQQLDILVQRINELDAQIEQGEQDIADTRISINANYTKLKKRLRALYHGGRSF